jgi:DNA-binding MarR family transcriptional regulator
MAGPDDPEARVRTAEQLRYLVLAAQLEGRRQLAQALRPLGLTPSQAEVLRVLADHAPLSLNGLGELLVCESGSSPSRLVDRVVARGLVDRRPGSEDGRAVELTLTDEGRRLAGEVAIIEERMYRMIDDLAGPDVGTVVEFLAAYVAGSPVGDAFRRRNGEPVGVSGDRVRR